MHTIFSFFNRLKLAFYGNCFSQNFQEYSSNTIRRLLYSFTLVFSSFDTTTLKSIVTTIAKSKEIFNEVKSVIMQLWNSGKSYRKLPVNCKIAHTTVASIVGKYKRFGTVENLADDAGLLQDL